MLALPPRSRPRFEFPAQDGYCVSMAAVAIHELREDLDRFLDRVAHGETLEVVDQGRPVALLSPIPEPESALDRLRREGKVIPSRLNLLDLSPPLQVAAPLSVSQALAELRSED